MTAQLDAGRREAAQALHSSIAVGDMHVHPLMGHQVFGRAIRTLTPRRISMLIKLLDKPQAGIGEMLAGGYKLALATLYAPELEVLDDFWPVGLLASLAVQKKHYRDWIEPSSFAVANMMFGTLERDARAYGDAVRVITNVDDLRELTRLPVAERPLALVPACEGAHVLNPHAANEAETLANLKHLYDRGLAALTLVHFFNNRIVEPVYPYPRKFGRIAQLFKTYRADIARDDTRGLSTLGERVVEYMAELGMLIDMTHCTPAARKRIFEIAGSGPKKATLLMTHVGAHKRNPTSYNPTDDEIRQIAESGGMVGVIFMNYWLDGAAHSHSITSVVETIRHFRNIGGDAVVGFGSDFDGFATPPADLPDARHLPRLTEALLEAGFRDDQIRAYMGDNLWRTLINGWRRARPFVQTQNALYDQSKTR